MTNAEQRCSDATDAPGEIDEKSVTQGAENIPEVMSDLMRVSLRDVERSVGSDFWMRSRYVVGRFEASGTPRIGGSNERNQTKSADSSS